jgi:hypothetical protein
MVNRFPSFLALKAIFPPISTGSQTSSKGLPTGFPEWSMMNRFPSFLALKAIFPPMFTGFQMLLYHEISIICSIAILLSIFSGGFIS